MRILREAYTELDIEQRISDTKNILQALKDSFSLLASVISESNIDKELADTLVNYARVYKIDIEDMIENFSFDFDDALKEPEEDEEDFDDWDEEEEIVEESLTQGSVSDYLNKMKGKSKAEAQKIVMKSKGNPNADKAYEQYISSLKESYDDFYSHYKNKIKNWSTMASEKEIYNWLIDDLTDLENKSYNHNWKWDFSDGKDAIAKSLLNKAKKEFDWLHEDTEKNSKGKWVNKGDTGETHGEFDTKKEADAQRKAIFASGWKK